MNETALKPIVAEWLEETRVPELTPRTGGRLDLNRRSDILAIVGPRRAGKTYLMYQYIGNLLAEGLRKDDILFVDFEDYRLIGFGPADMDALFTAFRQIAGKDPKVLFFDEVHHLPHWSRVLRTLHNRRRYRIVVSGSNSRLLGREVATELRGRYADTLILPFSFEEFLRYRNVSYTAATLHTHGRGKLLRAFDDYCAWGGYPEVAARETNAEKRKLLQTYLTTIFYKDIIEQYNIKAKALLESMMGYCLNTYADLFSISSFERQAKQNLGAVSKRTISNYLRYLDEAFFVILNEKFSFSPKNRLANPRKSYLIDVGFRTLGVASGENRGKILENIVSIELMRRRERQFYSRDRYECDFVILDGARPRTAVQVAWQIDASSRDRELRGLAEAMESFGIRNGMILTYNEEGTETIHGKKVAVRPVWKWLLGAS
ncbi:MAG: hypothetical protein A3G34_16600 [Candidatus Lindowbacteria bacterium RIFCSPLOWO2_12_FULL_62_27]|nr:MAG: hypothetical protein A3I06_00155 [Candidatus Lindowbacteria bacterium RIFCSPLOWO2_02_FULL_62_12]OGH62851.1 MAG: hypothetical protein A3G34_16600 [Candidatus Lindowbacteria bacterium RIFCSPLOWO2_12_FULL_62_27]